MNPLFLKCLILGVLAIFAFRYYRKAQKTPTDDKTFGWDHVVFLVLMIYVTLVASRLPYVSVLTDTCIEAIDFVSKSVADKFNKQQLNLPTSVAPSGSPNDYIVWVDRNTVKPAPGLTLQAGWSVSWITKDRTQHGRILADTAVPADIEVYFDPLPTNTGAVTPPSVPVVGRP